MNAEWMAGLNTLQNASELGTVLLPALLKLFLKFLCCLNVLSTPDSYNTQKPLQKVIGRLIFIQTGTASMENIF